MLAVLSLAVGGVGWIIWQVMAPTQVAPPPSSTDEQIAATGATTGTLAGGTMLPRFDEDLAQLTQSPHRLPGTPQGEQASSYIHKRLQQIGIKELFVQKFSVPTGLYKDVAIRVDGGAPQPLYACRPNMFAGAITPKEGITGRTIYARSGRLADYGTGDPKGKIVILDFANVADRWQTAFAMGARAVLFVGDDEPSPTALHHVNLPAFLPRFYLPREQAKALGLLDGSRVATLQSRIEWEGRIGRNIVGVIRGRQPVSTQRLPEAILLAAPIDSFGEVPNLAKGARQGANAAALLGIAEYLNANPPDRDVIVCFFDAQAQFNAGARAFYGAIMRKVASTQLVTPLKERGQRLERERAYTEEILRTIDDSDIMSVDGDRRKKAIDELRLVSRMLSNDQRERLNTLREQAGESRGVRENVPGLLDGSSSPSIPELVAATMTPSTAPGAESSPAAGGDLKGLIEREEQAGKTWSDFQRDLNSRSPDLRKLAGQECYEATRRELRRLKQQRMAELLASQSFNADATALSDAVGGNLIVLHLSLDFGDSSPRWTVVHGDRAEPDRGTPNDVTDDRVGIYQQDIFKAFQACAEKIQKQTPGQAAGFDVRAVSGKFTDPTIFAPGNRADSGQVARLFGVWNLAAVTTFDLRARDGQPCDTVEAMAGRQANIRSQAGQLARMVWALGRGADLSVPRRASVVAWFGEAKWSNGTTTGDSATVLSTAAAVADRPAAGGIVAAIPNSRAVVWSTLDTLGNVPGFEHTMMVGIDSNGNFELGPIANKPGHYAEANYLAAMFHDPRGMITHIANADTVAAPIGKAGVKLFKAKCFTAIGAGFEREAKIATQVLRAKSTAPFRTDFSLLAEVNNIVVTYVQPGMMGIKLFNGTGTVLLNNSVAKEAGDGVPIVSPFDPIAVSEWTTHDLWTLNEARLSMLRRNHIMESSLQRLHGLSQDIRDQAGKPLATSAPSAASNASPTTMPATAPAIATLAKRQGDLQASAAVSRRVYQPLLKVLNDLVVAVVFLMLLAMPFAYAMERLIIGTPHIYRQIGYVTIFFVLTFGVLYFVNPAFRIAATPIIIFLAFAIIVLSAVVIFIMMRKLREEIKRMQGLGTTVHSSDVSRLSTMMAAVNMGISTMRRRPIRTILTAVTVVLLTFTILTFASFSNTWGIRKTYVGTLAEQPPRVMVRQAFLGPLPETVVEMYRGRMEGRGQVVSRWWVSPTAQESQDFQDNKRATSEMAAVALTGQNKMAAISALVGLEMEDLRRLNSLASIFPDRGAGLEKDDGIYLTIAMAEELEVKAGDQMLVAGQKLKVLGVLSPGALSEYAQMEGSSLLPVDYQSSQGGRSTIYTADGASSAANDVPDIESTQFVTFSPDRVGFVSAGVAERMGGKIRGMTIYPADPGAVQEVATEAARLVNMPAYVGDAGGVYRLYFTTLTQASGFRDLVIPVVLGGLIVFATMLGSVSDREREIYTFSALGLAPPHVASLFFAEASVYAVVGGMGGYLLGQTVGRVLGWLASMRLVEVPPMNYSSINAVVTLLIVMATVLISTIYPALKASRSANPGVARMWRIPHPKGDLLDIIFPFTVSSYDITGVVSFLKEHFDNFGDTSLGLFATERSRVFRQAGNDMLGFEANVALAPFDLGVTQSFMLLSQPSEIEGIDEVRILIRRRSGSPGDWTRSNRVFISDLRRQLLIWRSLPAEVVDRYRKTTLDQWETLSAGSTLTGAEVLAQ